MIGIILLLMCILLRAGVCFSSLNLYWSPKKKVEGLMMFVA